jgi:hypothetical protein
MSAKSILAALDRMRRPLRKAVWMRFVIPTVIVTIGVWWLLTDVLGLVG